MKTSPRVLICVVTYNNCADTLACLSSIRKLDYDQYDIVVVDNGSSDGTAEKIAAGCPDVVLIKKESNTGAVGGRNAGLAYALTADWKYIFFVDNDAIVDAETLRALVATAEKNDAYAAVGALTYYFNDPNKIWHFGGKVCWYTGGFTDSMQGVIDTGQCISDKETDTFPIGFGIVRTDAVRKVGLIDERFFIYYEEADWHARMKRAGYRLAMTPRAKIWHKASSSLGMESPEFYYYRVRNRLLFVWNNASLVQVLLFFFYFTYDVTCHTLLTLYLSKKPQQLRAVLLGIGDFIRGRFGKCRYGFH